MLGDLVAGYGSSDDSDDNEEDTKAKTESEGKEVQKDTPKPATSAPQAPPKKKLPSASAMMAATTSWAKDEGPVEQPKQTDRLGTKYNHVPPPQGVRAQDGVMGGGADYIRPVTGASLDATKVYSGERTLSRKPGELLVPPQVKGRKNVCTEDVGSWTTEKKHKGGGN